MYDAARAFVVAILPLAIGLALDFIYPFHRGPLLTVHPVHTSYSMAMALARRLNGRGRAGGAALWLAVVGSHVLLYGAALYAAGRLGVVAWIIVASYIVKVSMPVRLLLDQVGSTGFHLEAGDLGRARSSAQGLVRRDLGTADAGHVASAALESLFESLVDAVTSPLLYYVLLGPMGALLQRLTNTMDGAVGFRDPSIADVGWFSARMDTLINYVPARLTALLEIASCAMCRGDVRGAIRAYSRYRGAVASVNAGHPMSAAAGCLDVSLEKAGSYSLGEGALPDPPAVRRGIELASATLILAFALAAAALVPLAGSGWAVPALLG